MRYLNQFALWALDLISVYGPDKELLIMEQETEDEFEIVRTYKHHPHGGGSQLVLEIRRKGDEYECFNPEETSKFWAGKFRIPTNGNRNVPEKREKVRER